MKKTLLISIVLIFLLLIINNRNYLNLYSEREYNGGVTEHIDIKISKMRFDIIHYILDKKSNMLNSENLSGFVVNTGGGGYSLIPTHKYKMNNIGSLQSIGNIFSLCVYKINNRNDNTVVFFDGTRSVVSIDNELILLSSVFIGQKKHNKHPDNIHVPSDNNNLS